LEEQTGPVEAAPSAERAEELLLEAPLIVVPKQSKLPEAEPPIEAMAAIEEKLHVKDANGLFVQPGDRVLIAYNDEPESVVSIILRTFDLAVLTRWLAVPRVAGA
jgi:hypothetical protein